MAQGVSIPEGLVVTLRAACIVMLWGYLLIPGRSWAPPLEAIVISGEDRAALIDKLKELMRANQGLAKALYNCRTATKS
jgi:hypothetical protein